jgi:hypothetical protein
MDVHLSTPLALVSAHVEKLQCFLLYAVVLFCKGDQIPSPQRNGRQKGPVMNDTMKILTVFGVAFGLSYLGVTLKVYLTEGEAACQEHCTEQQARHIYRKNNVGVRVCKCIPYIDEPLP